MAITEYGEAIDEVLQVIGLQSFSTKEFVDRLALVCPDIWAKIVLIYGAGGSGSGSRYSSNSFIAQQLKVKSHRGGLDKLDFRPAPAGWGSVKIRYWSLGREASIYPDEAGEDDAFSEGAEKSSLIKRYERNPKARAACIEQHGIRCLACEFDFEEVYGEQGAGYIVVHHLELISANGKSHKVDPKVDMVPVCANCHAMLHRGDRLLTIDELKAMLTSV